jgi:hypothetical protein
LCRLAFRARRDLKLIMRGGLHVTPALQKAFSSVIFVDTTSFTRTISRRMARLDGGKLTWIPIQTQYGEPLDDLLDHNAICMRAHARAMSRIDSREFLRRATTSDRNTEANKSSLLTNDRSI